MCLDAFPNGLCAVFPCPEIDFDEVHAGLEIKIFENVCCRDFIEVAITEGCEWSDPNFLCKLDSIEFAELAEWQAEVFQVLVDAADWFTLCVSLRATFISALCNTAVTVDIIADVLCFKDFTKLLDLFFHLEKLWDLEWVLLWIEWINDFALAVFVVSVELWAVVIGVSEDFCIVNSIV